MKETNNPTPANPEPNVATITLPAGMTVEQFLASFASFEKMRDYTAKRDKCVRDALNILKGKHLVEYKGYLDTELKKVGLPIKGA